VIRQRWRVVVVVTLICVCLSLAWSLAKPASYRAQGRVIISTSRSLGTATDAFSGEQVSVERAPTYAQFLRGPEVATRAAQKLHGSCLRLTWCPVRGQLFSDSRENLTTNDQPRQRQVPAPICGGG
jgi:capsular polysaccharide biosynthesis protein